MPIERRETQWDVFCRVIDNHGDLGVCWRLAADLASRGDAVRLWIDDASALAWMAPGGAPGVAVRPWQDPFLQVQPQELPGDVVVEAFGCDPPAAFIERMAQRVPAPCWINLEYLSAEDFVRRSHRLPSPQQSGPGAGLTKWFFYPGFTTGTGGLLREPDLPQRRAAFDAARLRQDLGVEAPDSTQVVMLFCYDNPALPGWLDALTQTGAWLWVTPGAAARQVGHWLGADVRPGACLRRGGLTVQFLPYVPQPRFDELLWAADLNLVRGEDSLVRALWAGRPFVWQIYPQHDGAHGPKLQSFLDLYLQGVPADVATVVRAWHAGWNGPGPRQAGALPGPAWHQHARQTAQRWAGQPDLASELRHFAAGCWQPRSG